MHGNLKVCILPGSPQSVKLENDFPRSRDCILCLICMLSTENQRSNNCSDLVTCGVISSHFISYLYLLHSIPEVRLSVLNLRIPSIDDIHIIKSTENEPYIIDVIHFQQYLKLSFQAISSSQSSSEYKYINIDDMCEIFSFLINANIKNMPLFSNPLSVINSQSSNLPPFIFIIDYFSTMNTNPMHFVFHQPLLLRCAQCDHHFIKIESGSKSLLMNEETDVKYDLIQYKTSPNITSNIVLDAFHELNMDAMNKKTNGNKHSFTFEEYCNWLNKHCISLDICFQRFVEKHQKYSNTNEKEKWFNLRKCISVINNYVDKHSKLMNAEQFIKHMKKCFGIQVGFNEYAECVKMYKEWQKKKRELSVSKHKTNIFQICDQCQYFNINLDKFQHKQNVFHSLPNVLVVDINRKGPNLVTEMNVCNHSFMMDIPLLWDVTHLVTDKQNIEQKELFYKRELFDPQLHCIWLLERLREYTEMDVKIDLHFNILDVYALIIDMLGLTRIYYELFGAILQVQEQECDEYMMDNSVLYKDIVNNQWMYFTNNTLNIANEKFVCHTTSKNCTAVFYHRLNKM